MIGTILDYLKIYGDKDFEEKPFCDVDALVLCQLVYVKFDGLVHTPADKLPAVTLAQIGIEDNASVLYSDVRHEKENRALMKGLLSGRRFKNLKLNYYVNKIEKMWETQFCACVFTLENGVSFLAFRGTDETSVGWKEDFNMAFLSPVPGQELAVEYLNSMAKYMNGNFYVGGHSKGGNLAVYSTMCCKEAVQNRIIKTYSLDGPGFRQEVLDKCNYRAVAEKIEKIVPQSSLVGMIFETTMNYRVIFSVKMGLAQHDIYGWAVAEDDFISLNRMRNSAKKRNEALNEWLLSLNEDELVTISDLLYKLITVCDMDNLIELTNDYSKTIPAMAEVLKDVDDETADKLKAIVLSTFDVTGLDLELEKQKITSEVDKFTSEVKKNLSENFPFLKKYLEKDEVQ